MLTLAFESEFQGPNLFAPDAVVVARVLVSPSARMEESQPTALVEGCRRIQLAFPEWVSAIERTSDPELLAARTIAQWSLGALTEVRGFLHEAGARRDGDAVRLWVGFHHAPLTQSTMELATTLLRQAAAGPVGPGLVDAQLAELHGKCRLFHPDYQARILMEGARAGGIPFLPLLRKVRFWQFGWGTRSRFFMESSPQEDGHLGNVIQRSKSQTKAMFARLGMPTPQSQLVSNPNELAQAVRVVGWPCVIKPQDRGGGRGVTANIRTIAQLEAAFRHARTFSAEPLLVESHVPGDDHRITVLRGHVYAVTRREASWVTGDGRRTIAQLVSELNSVRSTNMVKSRYLRPIKLDEVLVRHLSGNGLTIDSVPAAQQRITLRSNANLSTGGICTDVTDQLHPDIRLFAEMFARALGQEHTGMDYISTDIGRPWQEGGGFIEANSTPGLDAMIAAGADPVKLAQDVLGDRPGRIPVRVAVVADQDLADAVAALRLMQVPPATGWACAGHAQVGQTVLALKAPTARSALHALLINPFVERVTVVCSLGELVRDGLPVDRADEVAVCTQISDDWQRVVREHAGQVSVHHDANAFAQSGVWG